MTKISFKFPRGQWVNGVVSCENALPRTGSHFDEDGVPSDYKDMRHDRGTIKPGRRHAIEPIPALLALRKGNLPVTNRFPPQKASNVVICFVFLW